MNLDCYGHFHVSLRLDDDDVRSSFDSPGNVFVAVLFGRGGSYDCVPKIELMVVGKDLRLFAMYQHRCTGV